MTDRCKNCEASLEYVDMTYTYDAVAEYARFSCSVCGWEWEEAAPIDWYFDDDELVTPGMA